MAKRRRSLFEVKMRVAILGILDLPVHLLPVFVLSLAIVAADEFVLPLAHALVEVSELSLGVVREFSGVVVGESVKLAADQVGLKLSELERLPVDQVFNHAEVLVVAGVGLHHAVEIGHQQVVVEVAALLLGREQIEDCTQDLVQILLDYIRLLLAGKQNVFGRRSHVSQVWALLAHESKLDQSVEKHQWLVLILVASDQIGELLVELVKQGL